MVGETRWDEKAGLRTGCGGRSKLSTCSRHRSRRPATKTVTPEKTRQHETELLRRIWFAGDECDAFGREVAQEATRGCRQVAR